MLIHPQKATMSAYKAYTEQMNEQSFEHLIMVKAFEFETRRNATKLLGDVPMIIPHAFEIPTFVWETREGSETVGF